MASQAGFLCGLAHFFQRIGRQRQRIGIAFYGRILHELQIISKPSKCSGAGQICGEPLGRVTKATTG